MELSKLSQEELIELINAATVYLDYQNYLNTHLYINGRNSEPELLWWDPSK